MVAVLASDALSFTFHTITARDARPNTGGHGDEDTYYVLAPPTEGVNFPIAHSYHWSNEIKPHKFMQGAFADEAAAKQQAEAAKQFPKKVDEVEQRKYAIQFTPIAFEAANYESLKFHAALNLHDNLKYESNTGPNPAYALQSAYAAQFPKVEKPSLPAAVTEDGNRPTQLYHGYYVLTPAIWDTLKQYHQAGNFADFARTLNDEKSFVKKFSKAVDAITEQLFLKPEFEPPFLVHCQLFTPAHTVQPYTENELDTLKTKFQDALEDKNDRALSPMGRATKAYLLDFIKPEAAP